MIQVKSFTFNPFAENTFVLYDESKKAIIVDPGCYESQEKQALIEYIENNDLSVVHILNTHGHIDHVLGNYDLTEHFGVGLTIFEGDMETLRSVKTYAASYGFQNYTHCEPTKFIHEGDTIVFGNSSLEVIFVPGHSPGHIAFVNKEQNLCIGGDVLFQGSIGRTDLPGGDFDTLIKSIHEKMFPLGDDMIVHCGHGPSTTIGMEKTNNPFCALPG